MEGKSKAIVEAHGKGFSMEFRKMLPTHYLRLCECQGRTLCPGVVEMMGAEHVGAALGTQQVLTSVGSWYFLWFSLDGHRATVENWWVKHGAGKRPASFITLLGRGVEWCLGMGSESVVSAELGGGGSVCGPWEASAASAPARQVCGDKSQSSLVLTEAVTLDRKSVV